MRCAALALVLLLAGCVDSASTTLQADIAPGSPLRQDTQSGSADCGDQAELHIDIGRIVGRLTMRVLDGGGQIVFNETYEKEADQPEDNVEGETERGLFGETGTWTLQGTYRVTDLHYTARLSC